MRKAVLILFVVVELMTVGSIVCAAQRHASIHLTAGPALGFVAARQKLADQYGAITTPRIGLRVEASLGTRVDFVTGVEYLEKGFRTRLELEYPRPNQKFTDVYENRTRYRYLSVPLQAQLMVVRRRGLAVRLGGGMSYGFLLHAASDWDHYSYRSGLLTTHNVYATRPKIGLMPPSRFTPVQSGIRYSSLYLFQPAVAATLKVAGAGRLSGSVYYERNLYNAEMEESNSVLRLQSVAILLGVRL